MAHTIETLTARYAANNTDPMSDARTKYLTKAIELGASDEVLELLCDCLRFSYRADIILPAHRFENLSRGRGWARQGKGSSAVWGERTDKGYSVGPGKWTVGGNDGFSRKGEESWVVRHVKVGSETWTIAD